MEYKISSFKRLVIVAENYVFDKENTSPYSQEVNSSSANNVAFLKKGFEKLFGEVIIYDDLSSFRKNVSHHKNDIVFPYWHGKTSRNRQALVASICEVEDIVYIGADAYANIICCDKILTKDACRLNNVKFPKFAVINQYNSKLTWEHDFPVVVKPVYEGASVGITKDSLQYDLSGAQKVCKDLLNKFNQPILIEEFIPGREVSVAMIGWGNKLNAWSAAERSHKKDSNYFNNNIYCFTEKIIKKSVCCKDARELITPKMLENLKELYNWLDKLDYIRIDGKIWNGEFWCIELSHDTTLHPEGSFFGQLNYIGYDFEASLKLLVDNCLERYNNLLPSQQ
jgi:D-alanine-D-alanine ligase